MVTQTSTKAHEQQDAPGTDADLWTKGTDSVEPEVAEDFVSLNGWKSFDEPGDSVTGVLLGYHERPAEAGERPIGQFSVLTEDGLVSFNVTSQLAVLRKVPAGTEIQVTFSGEGPRPARGNAVKLFEVRIKRSSYNAFRSGCVQALREGKQIPSLTPTPTAEPSEDFADPFVS